MKTSRILPWALATSLALASPAFADWLVTVDGARVETRGPWTVKGKTVVFTDARGALSSLRLAEVDLAASEMATREAVMPPPPPAAPPPAPPPPPPALVLTDANVGRGTAGPRGVAALTARLEEAHRAGDVDAMMREVHWQGATPEVRRAMREAFEWMAARPLTSIELVAASAEDTAPEERQGRSYRPNLEVTGKLLVRLQPIADDGDAEVATATFLVGDQLGVPRLAAAVAE